MNMSRPAPGGMAFLRPVVILSYIEKTRSAAVSAYHGFEFKK